LGLIGFGQDSLLVLGCEDAALGSGEDLGVGAASTDLVGADARRVRGIMSDGTAELRLEDRKFYRRPVGLP